MCKSSDKSLEKQKNPEVGQFDDYDFDSLKCNVIAKDEVMVGEADKQQIDNWLGDTGSSHHIKSSAARMINVTVCP